ncbi:MAG: hypothetical protein IJH80_03825 [Ruminococcus sp.]|nr:hypothetical protein [Ruminococcus sp.]
MFILMSSTTKQKSSAGKNVFIFFLVFIILEALVLFGIGRVFKNKDVTPSIAGYSLYLMDSGAMGDSVPQGSLVIASNMTPSVDKIGDAVVCENVPGIGTSVFRLAEITQTEDKTGVNYTIYQENNPQKQYTVKAKNIVGIASSYYMTAGKVLNFVISKFGFIVCLAVPLFLLVVLELIIAIATGGSYEEDEDEDEEFDRDDRNENVSLDDFLFGGQNEGEQIAQHRRQEEQAAEQQTYAQQPAQPVYQQPEPVKEPEPVFTRPEPVQPAAEPITNFSTNALSDDSDLRLDVSTPARRPAARRRPRTTASRIRPTADKASAQGSTSTNASQSLEDLMKLMEQEQQKLKDQINNNNK